MCTSYSITEQSYSSDCSVRSVAPAWAGQSSYRYIAVLITVAGPHVVARIALGSKSTSRNITSPTGDGDPTTEARPTVDDVIVEPHSTKM